MITRRLKAHFSNCFVSDFLWQVLGENWEKKFGKTILNFFFFQNFKNFQNLCTYLNSFVTLRIPQNTGVQGTFSSFYSNLNLNNTENWFPLNIFHTFHFEFAYTQYIFNCFVCANRFTAICFPIRSEKVITGSSGGGNFEVDLLSRQIWPNFQRFLAVLAEIFVASNNVHVPNTIYIFYTSYSAKSVIFRL